MKKIAILGFISCALALGIAPANALGHGNEQGEAEATIGNAKVKVAYGRPMLKGRDIKKLIQPGQIWRIGADVPTTIESNADLDFGGTRIPKGKHVLLARMVAPGEWSLVISGQPVNHYEPSAKLAEVPLKLDQGKDPVEELTINLSSEAGNGVLAIAWGTDRLTASFKPAS